MAEFRATIVCVNVGDKYPMHYVSILMDMVARHLPEGNYRFACVTDRPAELPEGVMPLPHDPRVPPSWWQKIKLFDPALGLTGRIVYFDLDVCITGRLDRLIETKGIIRDWHYPSFNSSVMVWNAGEHTRLWADFTAANTEKPADWPHIWTDQDYIYTRDAAAWNVFPAGWCVSYRSHAIVQPPDGAMVVCFHGDPKPQDVATGWVPKVWKIGGATDIPIVANMNVADDGIAANIAENSALPLPWFNGQEPHSKPCVLVGGGPTLARYVREIRRRQKRGAEIMAVNGAAAFLRRHGIIPDAHMLLDARQENVQFVECASPQTVHFIASQCAPDVFRRLNEQGATVVLYHALQQGFDIDVFEAVARGRPFDPVPGGSTVMLRAMVLASLSGFRRIHVYGMDSCYQGDTHHAYEQALNDGEHPVSVTTLGKTYTAAIWMIRQAQDFQRMTYGPLTDAGVSIIVHGDGLMPDLCSHLNRQHRRAA